MAQQQQPQQSNDPSRNASMPSQTGGQKDVGTQQQSQKVSQPAEGGRETSDIDTETDMQAGNKPGSQSNTRQ